MEIESDKACFGWIFLCFIFQKFFKNFSKIFGKFSGPAKTLVYIFCFAYRSARVARLAYFLRRYATKIQYLLLATLWTTLKSATYYFLGLLLNSFGLFITRLGYFHPHPLPCDWQHCDQLFDALVIHEGAEYE